jgi:metal-responsive CopG/Arc/MetJ family transcriptional regulator
MQDFAGYAQRYAAAEMRNIMEDKSKNRTRISITILPDAVQKIDDNIRLANCKSRSEFIERAVNFYAGYVSANGHTEFLADVIANMVAGTISVTENRLARLQFKEAVELAKLSHMLAAVSDVDDETLQKLHIKCVNEVKRINGVVKFEDAVQYQNNGE